jgi:hypothetical protein
MTIARLLPLHIHGALEAALGLGLIAASLAFGLNAPALVFSFVLGALILGVALASHAGERSSLPVSAHLALDLLFSLASAGAAVAFGAGGDVLPGAVLAATALLLLLLSSLTRYSAVRT